MTAASEPKIRVFGTSSGLPREPLVLASAHPRQVAPAPGVGGMGRGDAARGGGRSGSAGLELRTEGLPAPKETTKKIIETKKKPGPPG